MKHTPKLIIILIISAFIYSCKKSGSSSGGINGTWYLTRDSTREFTNGVQTSVTGESFSNRATSFQFNSNGTGSEKVDTIPGSVTFNYKITGNNLIFNYPAQTYDGQSQSASSDTAKIGMLTGSSLELVSKFELYNLNGSTIAGEADLYFSK
jgi:hypothetical protein